MLKDGKNSKAVNMWFNVVKAMKCPECKKRAFGITQLREPGNLNRKFYAQHAKYECTECGHTEVI